MHAITRLSAVALLVAAAHPTFVHAAPADAPQPPPSIAGPEPGGSMTPTGTMPKPMAEPPSLPRGLTPPGMGMTQEQIQEIQEPLRRIEARLGKIETLLQQLVEPPQKKK